MSGKLIIVDDETETFTKSSCNCDFCCSTYRAVEEWENFVPETSLQKNMKAVIAKIEAKAKKSKKRKIDN